MNKNYIRMIKALTKLEPNLKIRKILENGVVVESLENGENVRFTFSKDRLTIDAEEDVED